MIRVPEIKLPLDSTEEDLLFYTAKQMKTDVKKYNPYNWSNAPLMHETNRTFILYVQWM